MATRNPTPPELMARPTTLDEIRSRAVIPIFATDEPNYAGLMGLPRATAYVLAERGEVPAIRQGRHWRVLVPKLRRQLGDLVDDHDHDREVAAR